MGLSYARSTGKSYSCIQSLHSLVAQLCAHAGRISMAEMSVHYTRVYTGVSKSNSLHTVVLVAGCCCTSTLHSKDSPFRDKPVLRKMKRIGRFTYMQYAKCLLRMHSCLSESCRHYQKFSKLLRCIAHVCRDTTGVDLAYPLLNMSMTSSCVQGTHERYNVHPSTHAE